VCRQHGAPPATPAKEKASDEMQGSKESEDDTDDDTAAEDAALESIDATIVPDEPTLSVSETMTDAMVTLSSIDDGTEDDLTVVIPVGMEL